MLIEVLLTDKMLLLICCVDACKQFSVLEVTRPIIAAFLEVLQIIDIDEFPGEDIMTAAVCDG